MKRAFLLFAYFGGGHEPKQGYPHGSKWITEDGNAIEEFVPFRFLTETAHSIYNRKEPEFAYLSPTQPWCRWHVQLRWPFFLAFHYNRDKVPNIGEDFSTQRVWRISIGKIAE